MGYTVELENDDLLCKSQADAEAAAGLINGSLCMSPYHLQVEADEIRSGDMKGTWYLCVEHFQGDHWDDSDARRVWLAIAPHMADGATIEFEGQGHERWRIRWQEGRLFEEYIKEVVWAVNQEITAPAEEKTS